jgi:hypothetical protein
VKKTPIFALRFTKKVESSLEKRSRKKEKEKKFKKFKNKFGG